MSKTWTLLRRDEPQSGQHSHIGGKPSLPSGSELPLCKLCGQLQTFVFQVAFPAEANWSGKTLSCFACMRCANERFLIPEMLHDHRQGCDIPPNFLKTYQRNFAFLVFPTRAGKVIESYREEVAFASLEMQGGCVAGGVGRIGGRPNWLLEDESPGTYDSTIPMVFLLELFSGVRFSKVAGALPQMELDIRGRISSSPLAYYQLFLGSAMFLFGTSLGDPLVYAVTQV